MALYDDLLEQAEHLAAREPRRPRQASLRRAVSAAYYALFHLLASEGARALAPNEPAGLRARVQRAFAHVEMNGVCQRFGLGDVNKLPSETKALVSSPLEPELVSVARAFVALQQARHSADYDVSAPLSRIDVMQKIELVRNAFRDWNAVRTASNARVFLAALLLQNRWGK